MASLFTRIIAGELPARFVWKDEQCVAFLTIAPLRPGHTLVVPRKEVDHWIDLEPPLAAHLLGAARSIGRALMDGFRPAKVGMTVVGLEVPHVHLHLVPINSVRDMDFARQDAGAKPADLDAAAATIRASLRRLGCPQVAD